MKRNYFNTNTTTAKNINDVYEHVDKIKLNKKEKFFYHSKGIFSGFSKLRLFSGLNASKHKLKTYVDEGKPISTATQRYKFIDKLIKRALNAQKVKYSEFGFEHIPKTPVLFIANHKSNIDALLILHSAIQHFEFPYVRVVAKKELEKGRFANSLKLIDTIFVDRSDIRNLQTLIKEEVDVFQNDCSLLIFPEGTRVSGDKLGEFHPSSLEVAFQTYVPIVPLVIFGTNGFMSGKSGEKPVYDISEIVIDALEPIKYSEYMHWSRTHLAEVLQQRIQDRYDLWLKNYNFMRSSEYKKEKEKSPLEANRKLNEDARRRLKEKVDN